MKATELRLGNFVQYANGSNTLIMQVVRIFEKSLRVKFNQHNPSPIEIKDVSGIPLTAETIVMCGFQAVGMYENVFHRGDYRVFLDLKAQVGLLKYETEDYHVEIEVHYVHQLQNLYFALAGSELPVDFG